MSTDVVVLDSTITLDSSATEVTEVIELDSSRVDNEAIVVLDNDYDVKEDVVDSPTSIVVDDDATETPMPTTKARHARPNDAPEPAFKVTFRDERLARKYRQQIRDFLANLIHLEHSCEKDADASSLILEIWDRDNFKKPRLSNDATDSNKLKDNDNCSLFTVDKQPNAVCNFDIPTYGQKYENTFEGSNPGTSRNCAPNISCFNCNGNHSLRDCPLPKNQKNINKNRKEFATTKYAQGTGVRYHMNEDQRFSHLIPGQLSQKLRKALGLRDNELPMHIYRMRLLGYPPGWLEEARLQHSGLSLFNSDGMAENDAGREPGGIITDRNKDQYDTKKIYDFPGFNVLPPVNTIDDSHRYRVPRMMHVQSKEVMLSCLQGRKADDGYKRKKMKTFTPARSTLEMSSDMEIASDITEGVVENVSINGYFIPPLPKESIPIPAPPPSSKLFQSIAEDSDSQLQDLPSFDSADETTLTADSPSLSELENRKKQLLLELENTSLQSYSDSTSLKNDSSVTCELNASLSCATDTPRSARSSNSQSPLLTNSDTARTDPADADASFNSDLNSSIAEASKSQNFCTPTQTSRRSSCANQASVKSVHLGTPILPSTSPYGKLPSSEKFSRDICDVINFENLPDATGKYEKMTGVLQKVRNIMTRLNEQT